MKYKIFIDDTGSKQFHTPYNLQWEQQLNAWIKYRNFAENNFFVLTAVAIDIKILNQLNLDINKLKIAYFGTSKVELKSVYLRNKQKQKERYLNKYNIKLTDLHEFINFFYEILLKAQGNIHVISVVFNKMAFSEQKRSIPDGNPFLKTTQVLFDRIAYLNSPVELVIDQMESSLKATKGKNGAMFKIYLKKENFKTDFKVNYENLSKIVFKKSSNDNFLQVADIFGYNIFRQFVDHGLNTDVKYSFFEKILPLIEYKDEEILGKGLVVLGLNKKCYINKKSRNKQDLLKSVSSTDTHIA